MFLLATVVLLAARAADAQSNPNGVWTKVMLPGTHCLDGSPGAYYLREPLVPPSTKPNVLIYAEGGGWCDGLANCYARSLTDLGSSKAYPDVAPNVLPPGVSYEGASMFASASFAPSIIAYAKYCTGDSLTSSNSTPSYYNNTRLYFSGRAMLDALVASLKPRGLAAAPAVLVSGCSAGGLSAYSHVDAIAAQLPGTLVAGLADAMFALNVSAFPGDVPAPINGMYKWGFEAWNSSAGVNQDCLAAYGVADGAACLFGGNVAPFVRTPLFVVNSKHDTWQRITILGLNSTRCPGTTAADGTITLCLPQYEAEGAFWAAYGRTEAAHLAALPPRHGGFLTNCPGEEDVTVCVCGALLVAWGGGGASLVNRAWHCVLPPRALTRPPLPLLPLFVHCSALPDGRGLGRPKRRHRRHSWTGC